MQLAFNAIVGSGSPEPNIDGRQQVLNPIPMAVLGQNSQNQSAFLAFSGIIASLLKTGKRLMNKLKVGRQALPFLFVKHSGQQ
jgi:hypothetical protein